jgi:hypothetical protein
MLHPRSKKGFQKALQMVVSNAQTVRPEANFDAITSHLLQTAQNVLMSCLG